MRKIGIIFGLLFLSLLFSQFAYAEEYGSISGTVIGEDTKQGVGGVDVIALSESGGIDPEQIATQTDSKGVFVFKGIAPKTYILGFSKYDSPYIIEHPHQKVVLPRGKNVVNANHTLILGGSVAGTVTDSNGIPLSNTRVLSWIENPQPAWADGLKTTNTDSNGRYIIKGLPETNNCVVEIGFMGRGKISKTVAINKGKVTDNVNLTIKRDDKTGVMGYVRSSIDNRPIKKALVYLRDVSGNDIGSVYTDETGMYSIIGVAPGIYKVVVFWPTGEYDPIYKYNIAVVQGQQTQVDVYFNFPAPKSKTGK